MGLGKNIIIFAEDAFEDMELMYPKVFFADLGCKVTVAGTGEKQYKGKYGYPVSVNGEIWDFDPKEFDAVIVPGGWAPDKLRRYAKILDFVKRMHKDGKVVASICHGPWVLASAGIVKGRKLTCTPAIKDDMINAGAHYLDEKVIVDGNLVTPSNTEIIYALGAQGSLIACTRYCDFPPGAKSKPKVGGWLDINEELVKNLNPDLLLTSTFVQDKVTENYKNLGMNTVALMPTTLNGIFDSILQIGSFVDREKEAQELVDSIKNDIQKIKNGIKNKKPMPRVYIEEWHKPPHVSGNWVPKMVEIAGGDYSLIREGNYSRPVTVAEIVKFNPEIIILSICGLAENAKKEWILKRKEWENLSAVKSGNVFVVDDSLLNRPGPRIADGIKKLKEIIDSCG